MKLNKILAFGFAALTLSACSSDNDYSIDNPVNTASGVTVEMQQDAISAGEDMEQGVYIKVPVILTGEPNGYVNVKVEVVGTGDSPATEGEDFIVTNKEVSLNPEDKIAYVEFYPTGDEIENPDRQFTVTITSAEGATIGAQKTCLVTLIDNESLLPNAYRDIQGTWTVATDDDQFGSFTVNIMGVEEGADGYLSKLVITNFLGQQVDPIEATFSFDASTGAGKVYIPFNQSLGIFNFNGIGQHEVVIATVVNGNSLSLAGGTTGTTNAELTKMTFDKSLIGTLWTTSGSFSGYTWFWFYSMTFTKVQ